MGPVVEDHAPGLATAVDEEGGGEAVRQRVGRLRRFVDNLEPLRPTLVGDDSWELVGRVVGDVARRRHGAPAYAMALSRPDRFSRVSAF